MPNEFWLIPLFNTQVFPSEKQFFTTVTNIPDRECYTEIAQNNPIYSRSGTLAWFLEFYIKIFLIGNLNMKDKHTSKSIGQLVRKTRKAMGATQKDLALTSGSGLRFIIDLEQGKPTCQLEKVITVLNTLGIRMTLTPPDTIINHNRNA